MIEPFPAKHELISVFESEPRVEYPDIPWMFNTIHFELARGDDRVECEIQPGYEQLSFRWSRGGGALVQIDLREVRSLEIDTLHQKEALVIGFRRAGLLDLRIRLKPSVYVMWGTEEAWMSEGPDAK